MLAGLQAYGSTKVPPTPLIAYATFFRDGKQAFATTPIMVRAEQNDRLGTVPISLEVALGDLAAGQYLCQIMY